MFKVDARYSRDTGKHAVGVISPGKALIACPRYLGSTASDDGYSTGHFLSQILHELSVSP